MPPQFKIFRIPAVTDSIEEEELNTFLRSIKLLTINRDFVECGVHSFTVFTVEYFFGDHQQEKDRSKKSKIDFREVLPPEDFVLFSSLRQWRKKVAADEAIAVYTVFTNEQLAQIAEKRPQSKAALKEIPGIGEAKISKYSQDILTLVSQITEQQKKAEIFADETSRKPVSEDS